MKRQKGANNVNQSTRQRHEDMKKIKTDVLSLCFPSILTNKGATRNGAKSGEDWLTDWGSETMKTRSGFCLWIMSTWKCDTTPGWQAPLEPFLSDVGQLKNSIQVDDLARAIPPVRGAAFTLSLVTESYGKCSKMNPNKPLPWLSNPCLLECNSHRRFLNRWVPLLGMNRWKPRTKRSHELVHIKFWEWGSPSLLSLPPLSQVFPSSQGLASPVDGCLRCGEEDEILLSFIVVASKSSRSARGSKLR